MEGSVSTEILGLWQQQAREERLVPLNDIRTKAQRLDAKSRRWRVVTPVLFILILLWEAWQVWIQHETLERAGDLLTVAALLYVIYRFRKYHRVAPVALGRTNCLDFYRAELVRQRDLSNDGWGYLLPFVPGVALALFGGGFEDRPRSQLVAIAVFGVVLFLGIAWWNAHTARRLQNDIDALDAS